MTDKYKLMTPSTSDLKLTALSAFIISIALRIFRILFIIILEGRKFYVTESIKIERIDEMFRVIVLTKKIFKVIFDLRVNSFIRVQEPVIKKTFDSIQFKVTREVRVKADDTSREGRFTVVLKDEITIVTNNGNVKNTKELLVSFSQVN